MPDLEKELFLCCRAGHSSAEMELYIAATFCLIREWLSFHGEIKLTPCRTSLEMPPKTEMLNLNRARSLSSGQPQSSDDFDWIGSELSAPQDPIECVTDVFDGFISTNELSFLEDFGDFLGKSEEEIKTTPSRDFKFGMTKKKPRSKRRSKQRAWPMKDFVFSALENHEFRKRICTHCQIDKTPQWRIGPLGPKTLCNACGVRYNTGRLLPEYRPAASPSFDQNKHSNLHKQILRRRANLI
uniref:GATA-type domain-containing protein n=2 Tax=Populus trichocarpa TaxID=3694 RepID=A0A3N7G8B6_POPTR|eukprot:XP_024457129.1 GATA transcription factor 7 [Populus trichocarpa]